MSGKGVRCFIGSMVAIFGAWFVFCGLAAWLDLGAGHLPETHIWTATDMAGAVLFFILSGLLVGVCGLLLAFDNHDWEETR